MTTMDKNEIIHRVVAGWLGTEPDYLAFIEAFPDEVFEEYQDDDRVLEEMYRAALDELRALKYIYQRTPDGIKVTYTVEKEER